MIDLDVPAGRRPGPPLLPHWLRVPHWLRAVRLREALAALVILAVSLSLLGGAASDRRSQDIVTLTGLPPDGSFQVSGDVLIMSRDKVLTAYDLDAGGRRSWERRLATSALNAQVYGDALVLSEYDTLTVYDARTGKLRWHRTGNVYAEFDQTRLLLLLPGAEPAFVAVDVSSGRELWRRAAPDAAGPDAADRDIDWRPDPTGASGRSDSLVELASDGTVTVVGLETGAARTIGTVRPGGSTSFAWQGVLGVAYEAEHRLDLYDLDGTGDPTTPPGPVHPLWSIAYADREPDPCGPIVLCVHGGSPSTGEDRRLDLRTGEEVGADDSPAGPATPAPSGFDQCTTAPAWVVCGKTGQPTLYAFRRTPSARDGAYGTGG